MISVIATDLDGTFLTDGVSVSAENLAAVEMAAEREIPFLFATGRPIRWLDFLAHVSGHPHAISINGAAVVDLATGEVERSWPLDREVTREVVADLAREVPGIIIGLEHGTHMTVEAPYLTRETGPLIHRMDSADAVLDVADEAYKLIIEHDGLDTEHLFAAVAPVIGNRLTPTFSWLSPQGFIEVSAPGVSKRSTLEWFCAEHGISREGSVSFGDMPNDLEMLLWTERGYAMPGCHPSLLEAGLPQLDGDQRTAFGRKVAELLA